MTALRDLEESGLALVSPQSAIDRPTSLAGRVYGQPVPIRAGQILSLSWVPDQDVPLAHRSFVRRHVDRAAGILSLGPIRVRWFELARSGAGDFPFVALRDDELPAGVTPHPGYPMTIALLASLRGEAVVGVAVHEVRHVWQNLLRERLAEETFLEDDAGAFAAEYVRRAGLR